MFLFYHHLVCMVFSRTQGWVHDRSTCRGGNGTWRGRIGAYVLGHGLCYPLCIGGVQLVQSWIYLICGLPIILQCSVDVCSPVSPLVAMAYGISWSSLSISCDSSWMDLPCIDIMHDSGVVRVGGSHMFGIFEVCLVFLSKTRHQLIK